jgi:hypothetical protein
MFQNKSVVCSAAALLALAVACSKSSPNPASPTSTQEVAGAANADGSTLKATAPTPVSPINGAQPDSVVLVAGKSTGKFVDLPLSYQFQIRSGSTIVYDSGVVGGSGAGPNQVQFTPSVGLTPDTAYTWRARAAYQNAVGPWSADASFKAPVGGYIRGNELYDPLFGGRTVGTISGPTQWTSDGLKLLGHDSIVIYQLPVTLTAGEFGLMVKGADEGSEGDKSKIFSMQQGADTDITTNSYRFTGELRGANYGGGPGSISCRLIAGDGISRDCDRSQKNFDSQRWYFWRVKWDAGGSFTMEVRLDGPTGAVIYSNTKGLGGKVYKPTPHFLYLGAPIGRAGPMDATLPGGTYKNIYAGPGPRPAFPGE